MATRECLCSSSQLSFCPTLPTLHCGGFTLSWLRQAEKLVVLIFYSIWFNSIENRTQSLPFSGRRPIHSNCHRNSETAHSPLNKKMNFSLIRATIRDFVIMLLKQNGLYLSLSHKHCQINKNNVLKPIKAKDTNGLKQNLQRF